MHYSLIIPAWNEAEFLPETLQSVNTAMQRLQASSEHWGELIVVDNNSTDNTADIAREHGAKVVHEPHNQIARARNRGAASASGDALVFLDADTQCSSQLLEHCLDMLETGAVVGGGSLIAPDKPIKGAALCALKLWNSLAVKAGLAAGSFVFCRTDAFTQVGGFDTKVYAGEEIFLLRALKKWGKRHSMVFRVATLSPVVTSVRKLEWYGPIQIVSQMLLVLLPGAVYSRRLCRTWYGSGTRKKR